MNRINKEEIKELFESFKSGNISDFQKLYEKYNQLVYLIAFSILKNKEDSEDVMQIVFIKIYNLSKEKLPTKNQVSWVYSITKNEAISLLRKKDSTISLDNIYDIKAEDSQLINVIDKYSYYTLIAKLSDKEKEIVSLKLLADLSFDEIAKLLNEPTSTIKWRYYKSLHTLKILLGNLGMFVITFVIGLKSLFKKKNLNFEEQEIVKEDENKEQNTGNTSKEEAKTEDITSEITSTDKELTDKENQEILVESSDFDINYYGVGFLTISAIFLSFFIIFIIFFIKYQLKSIKKTSK